ncbi:MAG: uncharacterized protein H6Q89_2875, partial [Myxococcaceae bacterium]|nr:uncharacterized protein [Myxococcaceae bacterium]
TLYGNTLTRGIGAGLFWSGSSQGTMRNCTVAENVANGGGGFFAGAIADPGSSSIANLKIDNTLFVNNRAFDANVGMQCQKTVTNGANNLQWPQNRVTGGATDTACVQGITFADPQLGPLTDGGLPTAMPAAAAAQVGQSCPATDQLGRARATPCTVGAVER